jgi:uncharacterized protein YqeY
MVFMIPFRSRETASSARSEDRYRVRAAPWLDGTAVGSFPPMSEDLKSRLRSDLVVVRKARNRLGTVVLTTLLSEVRNREIEVGEELDDEGVQTVVAKAIKQRHDAAEQMLEAGRPELAEKESEEASILQVYLPPALSESEVHAIVREAIDAGATEMGAVMGRIMPRIRGRFDGKEANRIVREELA